MTEKPTGAGGTYPVGVIAKLLMLTERRVQQLVDEGVLPKAGRGKYELVPVVQGYIKYLKDLADKKQAQAGADGAPDYYEQRAILTAARAEEARLKVMLLSGQAVLTEDATALIAEELGAVRAALDGMIPILTEELAGQERSAKEVSMLVQKQISEVLKNLTADKENGRKPRTKHLPEAFTGSDDYAEDDEEEGEEADPDSCP